VVMFCDCVNPLTRDCGEGVGEFCDGGGCMFKAVCAALCVCHVRAFPLDVNTPQRVAVREEFVKNAVFPSVRACDCGFHHKETVVLVPTNNPRAHHVRHCDKRARGVCGR
jgi:hypothetical protein